MILKFVFGNIRVSVCGFCPELFLDFLRVSENVWDIEKISSERIDFSCSRASFAKIQKAARNKGYKLCLLSERGLPEFFSRYKSRYGLLFGALIFSLLIFVSTKFVWDIRVTGNENIKSSEIELVLQSLDFERGTYIKGVDIDRLHNEFLLAENRVSFISVNMKGTVANVEIKERLVPPPITDKQEPKNIVAKSDGIIVRADVISGQGMVEAGQTVSKGDLLISAFRTTRKDEEIFSSAKGYVYAKTYRNCQIVLSNEYVNMVMIDEREKYTAEIFGKKIPLALPILFKNGNYKKEISSQYVSLFGITLPIRLVCEEYSFYDLEKEKRDEKLAAEYINAYFENWIKTELFECKISDKKIEIENINGKYFGKCFVECVEDIGCEKSFQIE